MIFTKTPTAETNRRQIMSQTWHQVTLTNHNNSIMNRKRASVSYYLADYLFFMITLNYGNFKIFDPRESERLRLKRFKNQWYCTRTSLLRTENQKYNFSLLRGRRGRWASPGKFWYHRRSSTGSKVTLGQFEKRALFMAAMLNQK